MAHHRSSSPILFSRHHHPSTPAADIARLLDPSYSSSSSSSSNVHHAYLDNYGHLHDPDYRYFPVAQPKRTSPTTHHHSSAYNMATRPRWELIDEDALDLDDDAPEDYYPFRLQQPPTYKRHKRHSYSPTRPSYSPTRTTYSPAPAYYSPPHSFDSDQTVLNEYDESYEQHEHEHEHSAFVPDHKDSKRGVVAGILRSKFSYASSKDRKRRPSSLLSAAASPSTDSLSAPSPSAHHHPIPASPLSAHAALPPYHADESAWEKEERMEREREQQEQERQRRVQEAPEDAEEQVWTPTCTQALRREWQAVSLSIRFSIFRTQRKLRNRFF